MRTCGHVDTDMVHTDMVHTDILHLPSPSYHVTLHSAPLPPPPPPDSPPSLPKKKNGKKQKERYKGERGRTVWRTGHHRQTSFIQQHHHHHHHHHSITTPSSSSSSTRLHLQPLSHILSLFRNDQIESHLRSLLTSSRNKERKKIIKPDFLFLLSLSINQTEREREREFLRFSA